MSQITEPEEERLKFEVRQSDSRVGPKQGVGIILLWWSLWGQCMQRRLVHPPAAEIVCSSDQAGRRKKAAAILLIRLCDAERMHWSINQETGASVPEQSFAGYVTLSWSLNLQVTLFERCSADIRELLWGSNEVTMEKSFEHSSIKYKHKEYFSSLNRGSVL